MTSIKLTQKEKEVIVNAIIADIPASPKSIAEELEEILKLFCGSDKQNFLTLLESYHQDRRLCTKLIKMFSLEKEQQFPFQNLHEINDQLDIYDKKIAKIKIILQKVFHRIETHEKFKEIFPEFIGYMPVKVEADVGEADVSEAEYKNLLSELSSTLYQVEYEFKVSNSLEEDTLEEERSFR